MAIAKLEGELSKEQKQQILMIFENEFHMNKKQAQQLFKASLYLIKDEDLTTKDLDKVGC